MGGLEEKLKKHNLGKLEVERQRVFTEVDSWSSSLGKNTPSGIPNAQQVASGHLLVNQIYAIKSRLQALEMQLSEVELVKLNRLIEDIKRGTPEFRFSGEPRNPDAQFVKTNDKLEEANGIREEFTSLKSATVKDVYASIPFPKPPGKVEELDSNLGELPTPPKPGT